jgi:tRNA threonylcarbamoyladenosine biosynthesis protein TsaB
VHILAVDTTTTNGSVAVAGDGVVIGEARVDSGRSYSVILLPAVASLLADLALEVRDLDAYAVTAGPGSFTGLRVGISTVQGLSLASGRPCLGVSALDVHASRIVGESQTLVTLMNAYRDEVYVGVYDAAGVPRASPAVQAIEAVLGRVPAGAAFTGDAVARYRKAIEAGCPGARFPERSAVLAGPLALLASVRFAAGAGISAEALRPLYLRVAEFRKSVQ